MKRNLLLISFGIFMCPKSIIIRAPNCSILTDEVSRPGICKRNSRNQSTVSPARGLAFQPHCFVGILVRSQTVSREAEVEARWKLPAGPLGFFRWPAAFTLTYNIHTVQRSPIKCLIHCLFWRQRAPWPDISPRGMNYISINTLTQQKKKKIF